MWAGTTNTFSAGITTYSAKAPGRVTPTPVCWWQNSRRPALQLRQ
ncbi:MAG: hypothetical protein R2713_07485 [Ilumatobacteraceae bacterium]